MGDMVRGSDEHLPTSWRVFVSGVAQVDGLSSVNTKMRRPLGVIKADSDCAERLSVKVTPERDPGGGTTGPDRLIYRQ
jgi:hypothetical protein